MGAGCLSNSGANIMALPHGRVPSTPDFSSDSAATREAVSDTMFEISDIDALITALHYSGGRDPDTVVIVLSYLFDGA